MQGIAMRYSRYRHKTLQTNGHLFERRYKAKLVDVDTYFLTLLRYIHMNPVEAHIVTHPSDYPWSSHRAYLGTASISWLTTDFGLSMFSTDLARARAAYELFVLTASDDPENLQNESHPQDSRILGSDQFISQIPFLPHKPRSLLTLEQLAVSLCAQHDVSISLIRSRSSARNLTPVRLQILRSAIDQRIASLTEVARFLDRDPSTLCKLVLKHPLKVQ